MFRSRALWMFLGLAVLAVPASASDPVGIYAVIDRVVLLPTAKAPTAVQLWGVFAVADGPGSNYKTPVRGYLYYSVNTRNERATLAEWSDLSSVAGTGQPIGFGQRYTPFGRIRPESEPPAQPDVYPLGFGLVKVLPAFLGPTTKHDLERVPAPLAPQDGSRIKPGPVTLVASNVADANVRYVFEIEDANGARETSAPVSAGAGGKTSWSPKVQIQNGQRYTWRVWVVESSWRGPVASAAFTGAQ
jgi:hypothetical protein